MNFKVNLFFHLYETHITPLGNPILTVPRGSDGVGKGEKMGKKKFAKMLFRQNKVF